MLYIIPALMLAVAVVASVLEVRALEKRIQAQVERGCRILPADHEVA